MLSNALASAHCSFELSVLDVTPVPSGTSAGGALRNTIDLARHAEALGFSRYWLAEHHNAAAIASATPEVLITAVAAATSRIRVGSGGMMLPNHSPLKIAEIFRALHALYPGRIDLGLGRAAGTNKQTALALRRAKELLGEDAFPAQVADVLAYLGSDPDPALAFGPIKAVPTGVPAPGLFILGASDESAAYAGAQGLGYAYAHHFAPGGAVSALACYRDAFRASGFRAEPYALVAASMVCGESDAHAADLAWSGALMGLRFGQGVRDLPLPSVEEAKAYPYDDEEKQLLASARGAVLVGSPERVAALVRELAAATGAAEIMITSTVHDHEERKAGYSRLARQLGI